MGTRKSWRARLHRYFYLFVKIRDRVESLDTPGHGFVAMRRCIAFVEDTNQALRGAWCVSFEVFHLFLLVCFSNSFFDQQCIALIVVFLVSDLWLENS